MNLSFDDEDSFKEAAGSLRFNNPQSDPDSLALQQVGSTSNMPPQERNEDICFNNSIHDPNSIGQVAVGSSNGTPPQERIEDIEIF